MATTRIWAPLDLGNVPDLDAPPSAEDRIDPYLVWACLTRFKGYVPTSELAIPDKILAILGCVPDPGDLRLLRHVEINQLYTHKRDARFFTGSINLKKLREVWLDNPTLKFELGIALKAQPVDDAGLLPFNPPRIDANLLAVIDDGCPVFNRQFRSATGGGTRIHRLWDQGPAKRKRPWDALQGVYGNQLAQPDIDDLLQAEPDESTSYLTIDYALGPQGRDDGPRFGSHGSHVMDLAAGAEHPLTDERDAASNADLVFVNLPLDTVRDSSGGSLGLHVLDAVRYAMAHNEPERALVLNLSYGTQAGPHNGQSLIEQALDELLFKRPTMAIVLGAGNSRQARAHTSFKLAPGQAVTLELLLPDEDMTDSFVEIWYPGPAAGIEPTISVVAPDGGPKSRACKRNEHASLVGPNGVQAALLHFARTPSGGQSMALLALAGALPKNSGTDPAPSGRWTLEIELPPYAGSAVQIDAWVERDDLPHSSGNAPFAFAPGTPQCTQSDTLVGMACGEHTIVVGACRASDAEQLAYSSIGRAGRILPPALRQALAPADEDTASPGLRAGGILSGDTFRMGGTSVAAPLLAREIYNVLVAALDAPGGPHQVPSRAQLLLDAVAAAHTKGLTMRIAKAGDEFAIDPDD